MYQDKTLPSLIRLGTICPDAKTFPARDSFVSQRVAGFPTPSVHALWPRGRDHPLCHRGWPCFRCVIPPSSHGNAILCSLCSPWPSQAEAFWSVSPDLGCPKLFGAIRWSKEAPQTAHMVADWLPQPSQGHIRWTQACTIGPLLAFFLPSTMHWPHVPQTSPKKK